ncbi:MAG: glycosyltransferase [Lachnospiraceae bacterium]|nr:glycosyltransferase [Lachnospiraceae bacterium]
MDAKKEELSKIHGWARKSRLLAPFREVYAIIIRCRKIGVREGLKIAVQDFSGRLRDRVIFLLHKIQVLLLGILYRIRYVFHKVRFLFSRIHSGYGLLYDMKRIFFAVVRRTSQVNYSRKISLSKGERKFQQGESYDEKITFSILVPLYNTPEIFLREMIESVKRQTYADWQLCLADGSDAEHSYVGKVVKEYSAEDDRILYQVLENNGGISDNTNACLDMATGEYIVLFDHDDILHEAALYELRRAVDERQADFIYTDEAIFSKEFSKPDSYHFKTDFAIDDIRSNNYICHITCFSKKLLQQVGGLNKEFDGSQDFDLVLRLTEKAHNIVHIPKVLYFWRCHEDSVASDISAKEYCIDAGRRAVEAHLQRMGIEGTVCSSEAYPVIYRVSYKLREQPMVSIIIWENYGASYHKYIKRAKETEKDSKMHTKKCIESVQKHTNYANYEVLTCGLYESRNEVAKKAQGKYLLFLDNSCRCSKKDWLDEMLAVVQRQDVGAVGAKVVYRNDTIRDVGITLGLGFNQIGGNSFFRVNADNLGFMGNMYFAHNVSALCDSCLMIEKQLFIEAGGFEENYPSWYAGIDLSLKVRKLGQLNVVNPYAEVIFDYQEINRDMVGNYRGMKKYNTDIKAKWGEYLNVDDPYYNANLTRVTGDYAIRRW